ncbi:hypothetical protein BDN67DRAFT_933660 [Paxillus ammoniavirescens]|nr:hypothetical protein BDN67DRAFT_933660 [Paxillus ammoniavirescens]
MFVPLHSHTSRHIHSTRHYHRPWTFTVVRAHGLEHLRTEKSWRPIVTVAVGDHQCHELNLGSDGQNPNLKQCFAFHEMEASSRLDISIYHRASSKKKSKKRNLVANACCTLQELARLQAQQQCKQNSVEIKLNCISRHQRGTNKGRVAAALLVAKFEIPEFRSVPLRHSHGDACESDILTEEGSCSSPTASDSSAEPTFTWPEAPSHPEPAIRASAGYWSDSDGARSDDERDPLLKHPVDEPIFVSHSSDTEESDQPLQRKNSVLWFAASMLPTYTEAIAVNQNISSIDSIVDSFSPYRALRDARVDSDYERVLTKLQAEWSFVGASLVALAGLEAAVFGFSSGSLFTVDSVAKRAIAMGSIASGIGLSIDAWFLLAYSGADSAKFQKLALDIYGKYLFFCISARLPALCMFASAFALMTFLLAVAWSAWPNAVLVMSFVAGMLISLQFIVYGLHCVVVFIVEVVKGIRRGLLRCYEWMRPPPPAVVEKHR